MKYCETVRDIFAKGGDWRLYDEQLRFLRQSDPNLFPWDQIHWELPAPTPKNHQIVFAHNFPKGLAGPFMQENPARAVNSSTFALNLGPVTRPANAALTKANPKLHSPANKPTGLSHKPITPVKVHRLQFFLADYPPHLSSFLINGFRFGFSIQFHGERKPFESPNLKSAFENPLIVSLKL